MFYRLVLKNKVVLTVLAYKIMQRFEILHLAVAPLALQFDTYHQILTACNKLKLLKVHVECTTIHICQQMWDITNNIASKCHTEFESTPC